MGLGKPIGDHLMLQDVIPELIANRRGRASYKARTKTRIFESSPSLHRNHTTSAQLDNHTFYSRQPIPINMLYYQLVIAAFIALASEVIGAPIKSAKPFVIKGNDKNIWVTGTAIGGGELALLRLSPESAHH
jgi:hypothetical protein